MLQCMFDTRYYGADGAKFKRAQGLADGYMRALVDLGMICDDELLKIISEERKCAASRADNTVTARSELGPSALDFA